MAELLTEHIVREGIRPPSKRWIPFGGAVLFAAHAVLAPTDLHVSEELKVDGLRIETTDAAPSLDLSPFLTFALESDQGLYVSTVSF